MKGVKMNKQTAVEWLFAHLVPHLDWSKFEDRELFRKLKEEAFIMEWEQIVDAFNEGNQSDWNNEIGNGGQQYYNETFNQIKNDHEQSN